MDEEAQWSAIPAAAFEDLLRHPFCCGMAGYLDMRNLAVGMVDRIENIEGPEPDRRTQKKSQAQISQACRRNGSDIMKWSLRFGPSSQSVEGPSSQSRTAPHLVNRGRL